MISLRFSIGNFYGSDDGSHELGRNLQLTSRFRLRVPTEVVVGYFDCHGGTAQFENF
jgi:hypothetical protein